MTELQVYLLQQMEKLERLEKEVTKSLDNAPTGSLRITKNKNTYQYYWRNDVSNPYGTYIRKSEDEFIRRLVQKEYDTKFLQAINEEKKQLHRMHVSYEPKRLVQLYEKMPALKKEKIVPYVLPDEMYIDEWRYRLLDKKDKMIQKGEWKDLFEQPKEDGIFTEAGEQVKSKSEKILADKLFTMGIPYLYEIPVYLKGYGYVNPDFTILNTRTRKTYIWEHLGLMDKENYLEKNIRKIEAYEKNHFFVGDNLLLTYETLTHPISTKVVELFIQKYLC